MSQPFDTGRSPTAFGRRGPHGFAFRIGIARLAIPSRPSHPAPNVHDDREAPLVSEHGTARIMLLIWGRSQVSF
jgi:hypothetical protein